MLQHSRKDSVKYVHEYKPILAFKRPKNLRDFLVHSAFKDKTSHFSQACDRRRCSHCKNIIKTDVFTKKVQVGKDQEKAQSEKDSHSKNQGGKKPN